MENKKTPIHINNAPAPVGSYSQAIKTKDTLYISGQIPLNPFTGELILSDIETQTKQVLENIKALLEASDLTMNDLVKCSIFLTDINNFSKVDAIYSSYFNSVYPARETVQVSALPKGVDVEISGVAIL